MKLTHFVKHIPVHESFHKILEEFSSELERITHERVTLTADDLTAPPSHIPFDLTYSCFTLAKKLNVSPVELAKSIAKQVKGTKYIRSVTATGPYCNLELHRHAIVGDFLGHSKDNTLSTFPSVTGEVKVKVMIEYSSPNTNKPQHVGHIRNNLLGHASANLLSKIGFNMVKSSIVNDRGIHICKSMLAYMKWGNSATPSSVGKKPDHFVGDYYVLFSSELQKERETFLKKKKIVFSELSEQEQRATEETFLKNSALMQEARKMLQDWEAGDEQVLALWKQMNGWVYEGYAQTYKELGVDFDHTFYESEIYTKGKDIIDRGISEGKIIKRKDGSVIAELSKTSKLPDKILLRADGTSLYITQDLYLAIKKFADFSLDYSMYCIGSEQDLYMQQLIATMRLLGFPFGDQIEHLSYGMVLLSTGKMKSREGKVVDADELISLMRELAYEEVQKRFPEITDAEKRERAKAIGDSALKFYMHIHGRKTTIHFDVKKSISFEGATGPYLLYVYARCASILRKAGAIPKPSSDMPKIENDEWQVFMKLLGYKFVLYQAAIESEPSILAQYLFDLATTFNTFYHSTPVLQGDEKAKSTRLGLVQLVQSVLRDGLHLLDIDVLEEM